MNTILRSIIMFWIIGTHAPSIALEAWHDCRNTTECVVSEEPCYNPIAINKKFLKQNNESNERQRPLIQSVEYKGPSKEKYVTICKNKKCALKLK